MKTQTEIDISVATAVVALVLMLILCGQLNGIKNAIKAHTKQCTPVQSIAIEDLDL